MLTKELLAQVKKIEIKTRMVVDEITGGAYLSVFKGRGIEFDEVREYTDTDDIRDIDWNVTARMGAPFVKKYIEERELNVMLAYDVSASSFFGSGAKSKNLAAAEIGALLSLSAIRNHDKVGLLIFSDRTELYLPPRSGRLHGLRLIRELLAAEPKGRGTDIRGALERLIRMLHKKSVIFLISDLMADPESYSRDLRIINRKHDVVSVRILDPAELSFPNSGDITLEDAETGVSEFFAGGDSARLSAFRDSAAAFNQAGPDTCKKAGVDVVDIRCGEDIVKPLLKFFGMRRKKFAV
jgi:uncharacterized protein (DUF58 family)